MTLTSLDLTMSSMTHGIDIAATPTVLNLGIGRMFPGTPKLFLGTFWLLGTLEQFLGMPKIRTNKFLFHMRRSCFLARQRAHEGTWISNSIPSFHVSMYLRTC